MRIILCLLLALGSATVSAEWVEVGETVDGKATYFESTKIRKNGNIRKVWQIQDQNKRDEDGVMSRRILFEYDCKEWRSRVLSVSWYAERMAGGEALGMNVDPGKWSDIPPNTFAEIILKRVCTKQ